MDLEKSPSKHTTASHLIHKHTIAVQFKQVLVLKIAKATTVLRLVSKACHTTVSAWVTQLGIISSHADL